MMELVGIWQKAAMACPGTIMEFVWRGWKKTVTNNNKDVWCMIKIQICRQQGQLSFFMKEHVLHAHCNISFMAPSGT
jgi:hypothetical protein